MHRVCVRDRQTDRQADKRTEKYRQGEKEPSFSNNIIYSSLDYEIYQISLKNTNSNDLKIKQNLFQ